MRRPSVSWIALGALALSSVAVIFAAGSSAPAASPPSTTTSSSEESEESSQPPSSTPPDSSSGYSANCETERDAAPAPGVGTTTPYQAGEAGSVKVIRTDQVELEVDSVEANPGWKGTETVGSGQGVKVKFMTDEEPRTRIHLAVTLNNSGTEIHTRLLTCPSQK
jgi:hypothetical protein